MPRRVRKKQRRSRALRTRLFLAATAAALVIPMLLTTVAGSAIFASVLTDLPTIDKPQLAVAQKTRIYSADGKLLAELFAENREPVGLRQIAKPFIDAIIATEDQRYYQHPGVDLEGVARAVVKDLTTGRAAEGASTITQQFIRSAYLTQEKTFARKLREMVLAYRLEKKYSKDEILNMYLNTIYFGEGAYGIQAASWVFFSKKSSDLTLPEAALLAGLPQSPTRVDPFNHPKAAAKRRAVVLARMEANGLITKSEAARARKTPLGLKRGKTEIGAYIAPYFVEFVKQQLLRKYGEASVFRGGLKVYTTLDTRLQGYAERAVANALPYADDPDASLTSIDPRTGWIRAMYGGRDFKKQKYNLAVQGQRQPGSSFKTFVLVTALEDGIPPYRYLKSDSPITIPMPKPQKPWEVNNSEGSGQGVVGIEHATASSINVVFAQLIMDVGAKRVAKLAQRMGIMSPVPPVPAIALGGLNPGVTTYDMASANGSLANQGIHVKPTAITKIVMQGGRVLYSWRPERRRAVSASVAYAAVEILKGVINGGTGWRADLGRPAAGKTGTSQNYRDAWFCGFTPQLSTAVWVGYTKKEKEMTSVHGIRVFGGTFPAEIWHAYMSSALQGVPAQDFVSAPKPKYRWENGWYNAGDAYQQSDAYRQQKAADQQKKRDQLKAQQQKKQGARAKPTKKRTKKTSGRKAPPPPPPPPSAPAPPPP